MGVELQASSGSLLGRTEATAGTAWYAVVPGSAGLVTRLTAAQIDNGATNNGVYLMRAIGSATVQAAQAAADTTIVLDRDPSASGNTISSGDQVVVLASDGTYRRVTVSSWSASTLTLTVSALPAAVAAGTGLWNFGIYTDTVPATGSAHVKLNTPTSAVTTYDLGPGLAGAASEPLLVYSPNVTNQTSLNYAGYARTAG